MKRLALLLCLCALPLWAGPPTPTPGTSNTNLLGLCSSLSSASCSMSTGWTIQETTSTPNLIDPNGANAAFQITVTEGTSSRTLQLSDVITLDGMIASGTDIESIFLSIQKGDGQGGYTTVASAAVGALPMPAAVLMCPARWS